jgi:hypothetical protein
MTRTNRTAVGSPPFWSYWVQSKTIDLSLDQYPTLIMTNKYPQESVRYNICTQHKKITKISNIYSPFSRFRHVLNVACNLLCCFLAYEDGTECSETSAIKQHTPGNNPKDYTQQVTSIPKDLKRKTALSLCWPTARGYRCFPWG